jgi:archaellum biogenesis protein FlaJ (TadC family)
MYITKFNMNLIIVLLIAIAILAIPDLVLAANTDPFINKTNTKTDDLKSIIMGIITGIMALVIIFTAIFYLKGRVGPEPAIKIVVVSLVIGGAGDLAVWLLA